MYVTIDNICNQQIFQQRDGAADIAVSGRVMDMPTEEQGCVYAQLMRDEMGSLRETGRELFGLAARHSRRWALSAARQMGAGGGCGL